MLPVLNLSKFKCVWTNLIKSLPHDPSHCTYCWRMSSTTLTEVLCRQVRLDQGSNKWSGQCTSCPWNHRQYYLDAGCWGSGIYGKGGRPIPCTPIQVEVACAWDDHLNHWAIRDSKTATFVATGHLVLNLATIRISVFLYCCPDCLNYPANTIHISQAT